MITKCKICNKEIKTTAYKIKIGKGKFCSHKCSGVWLSKKIKRNCNICGGVIFPKLSDVKKGRGIFCSKKCRIISMTGKNNTNYKKIKIKCLVCGKEKYIGFTKVKAGGGKFCSYKCMGEWQKESRKGKGSPSWKGGKIKIKCEVCGKDKECRPYQIKINARFCSLRCVGIWHSRNYSGVNASQWKGGKTSYSTLIRSSEKYSQWRISVFKRDGFCCQECGCNKGKNLHAHHKKRFSVILDNIKEKFPLLSIKDIAKNYPDLWDIKNGITLCIKCHKKEHIKDRVWTAWELERMHAASILRVDKDLKKSVK